MSVTLLTGTLHNIKGGILKQVVTAPPVYGCSMSRWSELAVARYKVVTAAPVVDLRCLLYAIR
jgi:hypothetical protein